MSSSLTLKVTSALSRDGVSCEASNPHGNALHVFHFGSGEELGVGGGGVHRTLEGGQTEHRWLTPSSSVLSLQWRPRLPRPEWLSWPWPSAWASCSLSLLPFIA